MTPAAGRLAPGPPVTRLDGVSDPSPDPDPTAVAGDPTAGPGRPRLARARAAFTRGLRTLLAPDGLPAGAVAELESALGDIGREALTAGPRRLRRVRAEVAAAPPRLLDWMSTQVVDHPAVLYDVAGVEALAVPPDPVDRDGGRRPAARPGRGGGGVHPGGRARSWPWPSTVWWARWPRWSTGCATGTTRAPTWCAGSTTRASPPTWPRSAG